MTEIRLAKKKKLGVEVVGKETHEQRRLREDEERKLDSPRKSAYLAKASKVGT